MPSSENDPRRPDVPRNLKLYFLCLFRRGERWNVTEGYEQLMPQYLASLRREMEARRMIFAGPVTDDGDISAVAIIQAANRHEAAEIVNANPGVKSGHFVAELHPCLLPALDEVKVQYEN